MLNLWGIVVTILKMGNGRIFSMSGINSGHHMKCWNRPMLNMCGIVVAAISYVGRLWCPKLIPDIEKFLPFPIFKMATTIPHIFNIGRFQHFIWCPELIPDIEKILPNMKWRWNRTMLNLCGIVVTILNMATGRTFSMSGINSGHHYLPTYQILMISDNVEFAPPIFYAVFWQPFWKWQTFQKFWKRRIAPLMVTYQYVKFYVSIIIHLYVILSLFGTWTCPRQISGNTGQNFMKLGGVIDICF
jgi:hypothetical protein